MANNNDVSIPGVICFFVAVLPFLFPLLLGVALFFIIAGAFGLLAAFFSSMIRGFMRFM